MDFKKLLIALILTSLLVGCVCATSVTEFKIDDKFKELLVNDDYAIYADDHGDAGIGIYKTIDKTEDKDTDDDDLIDNVVHDDGDEYLTPDDDMKIDNNPDNTSNFTDKDHNAIGISEVIDHNGEKHVVVFWASSSSDMDMAKLRTALEDFNKNNNVTPVAV